MSHVRSQRIVMDGNGSYLGMSKGCFILRDRKGNEEKLLTEVQSSLFDTAITSLDKSFPGVRILVDSFLLTLIDIRFDHQERMIFNEPPLSKHQIAEKVEKYYEKNIEKLDKEGRISIKNIGWIKEALIGGVLAEEDSL